MKLGVAYYPEHWPEENWATDAKNMRESGMDLVRIGEFAWTKMEPREGEFDFDWLDLAIETLGAAGLKVILGTPTATPPNWLIHKHPEILPVDAKGIQMKPGVRKYYCHTSATYRWHAAKIAKQLAERYGNNPHVAGWQIDNEFGDHDTVHCYCERCRAAFITWCREKYSSLNTLNAAWGTVFWNQTYTAWEEIDLPYPRRQIGLNPSHLLDYYRFASDQVIAFSNNQVRVLRSQINEDQWITTNVIATYWEIDFKKLAKELDFLSWDCYTMIDAMSPLREPQAGPAPKVTFPPRPAMLAFVHDMMRSASRDPFWVMETAGQDRLVAYHTMAHGGGGTAFFRWKGARFGAEQYRGGYEYHGIYSERFYANQKLKAEINKVQEALKGKPIQGQVGMLVSYEMGWAYDIHHLYPRTKWIDAVGYWRLCEEYYTAFWDQNIPVDLLGSEDDWTNYPVLIVPCLYLTKPELNDRLSDYVQQGGILIVGPASGTKNWDNQFIETLPPDGQLKAVFGCELTTGEGIFGFLGDENAVVLTEDAPFGAGKTFSCTVRASEEIGFFNSFRPVEFIRANAAQGFGRFATGQTACTINQYGKGKAVYLGFSPSESFFAALIDWLAAKTQIKPLLDTPDGVEVTARGEGEDRLLFVLNHNFTPAMIRLDSSYTDLINERVLTGAVEIKAQETLVLKKREA